MRYLVRVDIVQLDDGVETLLGRASSWTDELGAALAINARTAAALSGLVGNPPSKPTEAP